jgi:hypothetical protein
MQTVFNRLGKCAEVLLEMSQECLFIDFPAKCIVDVIPGNDEKEILKTQQLRKFCAPGPYFDENLLNDLFSYEVRLGHGLCN